uniref:Reverse transcriptase domain-containing protein n=1 Tax=Macrostomum lignano TaxID=282301 RepID=A0A1I8F6D0_9PLAT
MSSRVHEFTKVHEFMSSRVHVHVHEFTEFTSSRVHEFTSSRRFWISHSNARMNIVTFMQRHFCQLSRDGELCVNAALTPAGGDFQSGGESSLAHFVTQCELARCTDDSVTINREVPWPIDTRPRLHCTSAPNEARALGPGGGSCGGRRNGMAFSDSWPPNCRIASAMRLYDVMTMASQAEKHSELNPDNADLAEAWLTSFAATARIKKLTDTDEIRLPPPVARLFGSKQSKEEDMIAMRLVDGLASSSNKRKILERLQQEDLFAQRHAPSYRAAGIDSRDYNQPSHAPPVMEQTETAPRLSSARSRSTGCALPMQVDTGAEASLLPSNLWKELGCPRLRKCDKVLRQFDGSRISCLGMFTAAWESQARYFTADLIVTAARRATDSSDDAKPFYVAARPVPLHLRERVNQELKRLEAEDILEAVPPGRGAAGMKISLDKSVQGRQLPGVPGVARISGSFGQVTPDPPALVDKVRAVETAERSKQLEFLGLSNFLERFYR